MANQADDPESTPEAPLKRGWLEIFREPDTREAVAFCPYRARMLRVGECFACEDCAGLAMDGPAKHSYVVCARAERDGIATSACPTDAPIDDTAAWSVRIIAGAPTDDADEG